MQNRKWLLIISLGLNLIMGGYILFQVYKLYTKHEAFERVYGGFNYYLRRNELFDLMPKDSGGIFFLGDSHIQNFEPEEFFSNCQVRNRGIDADITAGLANRLYEVVERKPAKVFIEIGVNDVSFGFEQDTILRNYRYILNYINYNSPATKVYALSIFPNGWFLNGGKVTAIAVINEINKKLEVICKQEGAYYIDVTPSFMLGSHINPNYYMYDSLHLSPQGYLMLRDRLEPYVNE